MSKRLDWDKAKKLQPLKKDPKATDKQRAFILRLMPEFPRKRLTKITVTEAANIIDERLGKKAPEKKRQPRKTNCTSIQAEACKKHGVSGEVRVTLLRDRPTPGVRTRTGSAAAGEQLPPK